MEIHVSNRYVQVMHRVGVQIILLLPMNLCLPRARLMVALILLKKAKEFTPVLQANI